MIELVPATAADFITIAHVHAQSWKAAYRGILSDQYLDNEVENDRLQYWIEKRDRAAVNQKIVVAWSGNEIAGFNCFYLDDNPEFGSLIDNLHVLPRFQKSGAGRKLMKFSAEIMNEVAISKKMYLWVFEANTNARHFYEKVNGSCYETVDKQHEDGSIARVCRYIWNDVSGFMG